MEIFDLYTSNHAPSIQIDFKKTNDTMHDRYIILDYGKRGEKIYHCGVSSKDAGRKATTITEIQDRAVYKHFNQFFLSLEEKWLLRQPLD